MEDYRVMSDGSEFPYYAVFRRVTYPSGTTAFWQQVTKWYFYKGWAVRKLNDIQGGN